MAQQYEPTIYEAFKARLVMGSRTELKTTDHEGKNETEESKHHWFMGFAIPKGPEWDKIWGTMWNAAVNDQRCGQSLCEQTGFNWKYEDCDKPDKPSNLGTESYPSGHMLLKFSRYKAMGPAKLVDGNYVEIINANATKKGDYFYLDAGTLFNGASTVKTNAGMYQNIYGLMFAESGPEIVSQGGFDAEKAFANVKGGTVPNGTNTPPAQQGTNTPPAQQGTNTPPAQQGTNTPPPPARDLVGGPGNADAPPPPPAEDSYVYDGVTKTESAWESSQGWSGGLIKKHGTLVA